MLRWQVFRGGSGLRSKIESVGEGLCVHIPRAIAEEAGIDAGAEVEISVRLGGIYVTPVGSKRIRLETLLRAITRKKREDGED